MKKGKNIQIRVQVVMSNNLQVYGDLTIADGYRSRVSDLPLTNVVFQGTKSKSVTRSSFLCINKEGIVFLAEQDKTRREPLEEQEEEILEMLK